MALTGDPSKRETVRAMERLVEEWWVHVREAGGGEEWNEESRVHGGGQQEGDKA